MDKYDNCPLKSNYSMDQSICFKNLVLDEMRKKKVKRKFLDNIVVLSKSPFLMDHPNEVAHLNFNELVMGFYPDNIRNGGELKKAIDHEIAHLIANDKSMPEFHRELKNKTILSNLVEKRRPRHNDEFQKEL